MPESPIEVKLPRVRKMPRLLKNAENTKQAGIAKIAENASKA